MAEIADDENVGTAGWHGRRQGEALGRWDQGIIAAVDQQKVGAQVAQLTTGEVEILDVAAHRLGQGRDQLGHALGVGIAHQRDHGAAAAAQPGLEAAHVGIRVGELGMRDLAQEGAVPRSGTRVALARTNTHLAIGAGLP